ncbi:ATP-binding protein [Streptomyces sp. NPDC001985]|uniref:ATP-binding protein n=1 Tax=Streptomyces sp. NPDC001985 TaxID=3154406 RepID=UPI00333443F1
MVRPKGAGPGRDARGPSLWWPLAVLAAVAGATALADQYTRTGTRQLLAWACAALAVLAPLWALGLVRRLRAERARHAESRATAEARAAEVVHLAAVRLPAISERLRTGRRPDSVPGPLAPAADTGDAFARALETVVEALGSDEGVRRERVLRDSVQAAFESVARNMHAMATVQQQVLDRVERTIEDPRLMAEVMKADHAAAQMTRKAQTLLVMCGIWPARRETRPVSLFDCVRGAQSRIVEFTRIEVHGGQTLYVVPPAVEGLMHAIAELLENATVFSPSRTQVVVTVREVGAGAVVEIDDAGLGMPPDVLRQSTARLRDELDLAELGAVPRLGLACVGRWARELGFTVELTGTSAYGGTRAVAFVPYRLLTEPLSHFAGGASGLPRRGRVASGAGRVNGSGGGPWASEAGAGAGAGEAGYPKAVPPPFPGAYRDTGPGSGSGSGSHQGPGAAGPNTDPAEGPGAYRDAPAAGLPEAYREMPLGGQPDTNWETPSGGQPNTYRETPSGGQPDTYRETPSGGQPDTNWGADAHPGAGRGAGPGPGGYPSTHRDTDAGGRDGTYPDSGRGADAGEYPGDGRHTDPGEQQNGYRRTTADQHPDTHQAPDAYPGTGRSAGPGPGGYPGTHRDADAGGRDGAYPRTGPGGRGGGEQRGPDGARAREARFGEFGEYADNGSPGASGVFRSGRADDGSGAGGREGADGPRHAAPPRQHERDGGQDRHPGAYLGTVRVSGSYPDTPQHSTAHHELPHRPAAQHPPEAGTGAGTGALPRRRSRRGAAVEAAAQTALQPQPPAAPPLPEDRPAWTPEAARASVASVVSGSRRGRAALAATDPTHPDTHHGGRP